MYDASHPVLRPSPPRDAISVFSFSSEEGIALVRQLILGPCHTPHDYHLEAVMKALDDTDVLALLPIGAGKTAIPAGGLYSSLKFRGGVPTSKTNSLNSKV